MKRIAFILFACIFFFAACEKEEPEIPKTQTEYFPNSVGMYWKYERFDSTSSEIDTITVSIIGDTMVSEETYKIWKYDYGDWIDREYVIQTNDSIKFFRTQFDYSDRLYIVPFELSLGWDNPRFIEDTSYVASIADLIIDDRLYEDVAFIDRFSAGLNIYLVEKIWIKPHVGLVKLYREHYVLGGGSRWTWKLIESNIQ